MDYQVRTIWNVIATLRGSAEPDSWVMIGNHRDAWVYGAVDPSSGTAATLETCRALGSAVRNGWKPRRTIVYASWDGEEYGLVGSTEWADEHSAELTEKALMLLNVDSAVGGHDLDMDGVPSLRDLMLDAAGAVTDVRSGRSLRSIWIGRKRANWAAAAPLDLPDPLWDDSAAGEFESPSSSKPPRSFSPSLNPMGSGSDYTAFLDHLGIPCVDAGFGGRYGVYHSVFDNFYWMERFGDPEFLTHAMAARLYTLIAMRAASADIFPLKFSPYGEALREYLDDLRRTIERRTKGTAAEAGRRPFSFIGLVDLVRAVKTFQAEAALLDRSTEALASEDGQSDGSSRFTPVNEALAQVERSFLLPEGLPGRPWFRHAVYAPGLTTGYACWPLPAVRQAVLENDQTKLALAVPILVARINAATESLRQALDRARDALTPAAVAADGEPSPLTKHAEPEQKPAPREPAGSSHPPERFQP
jgi:N-acetylated-alpha-linked acidic dipeptidase